MKTADQHNVGTGVLFLIVGVCVAIGGTQYRLGSLDRMGPGFFPVAAGVALAVVGAWVMGLALRRRAPGSTSGHRSGRGVVVVLASVVIFGLSFEQIGMVVAVPLLVGLTARAHPAFSWRSVVVSILVLLLLTWILFIRLLDLPFRFLPAFPAG